VSNCQKLYFLINDHLIIILYTDTSDYDIGDYLVQIVNGKELPIMFDSASLLKVQQICVIAQRCAI